MTTVRIAAFSDFRVQDLQKTLDLVTSLKPDVTLYAGDDVRRFGPLRTDMLKRLLVENSPVSTGIHACMSLPWKRSVRSSDGTIHHMRYRAELPNTVCFNVKITGKVSKSLLRQKISDAIKRTATNRLSIDMLKNTKIVFEKKGRVRGILHVPEHDVDYVAKFAKASRSGFGGVIGNDDNGVYKSLLQASGACDLHENPLTVKGLRIIGQEGSALSENDGIGLTVHSEDDISKHLDCLLSGHQAEGVILVSHTPPARVLDHAYRFGSRHVGSSAVRKFVKKHQPLLVLCGHVHSHGGCVSRVGRTAVINLASHDSEGSPGRVCLITISDGVITDTEWFSVSTNGVAKYSSRFVKDGERLNHVFLMPGVGVKTAEKMEMAGIRTIEDVISVGEEELGKLLNMGSANARKTVTKAKSIVGGKAIPQAELRIPKNRMMFVDIETDLAQSYVWLISVCAEGGKRVKQFYAQSPDQEKEILKEFLEYCERSSDRVLCYWAGTGFDERVIKCRMNRHRLDASRLGSWFDLCLAVKRSVILPTRSYSVKSVGEYAGYLYRHSDLDGITVAMMYQSTIGRRKPTLSKKLLEYGKDDVLVMDRIVKKIGVVAGLSRDADMPEALPASFERECAFLRDLRGQGMSVSRIAEKFGKGRDYVSVRLRQNPEKMKGRKVSVTAVGNVRRSSAKITEQISPTIFEVKSGRKTFCVSIRDIEFV